MKAFAIVGWDKVYENNRSRQIDDMRWVPVPNKHDGDGYTELVDGPDGAAIYGAWIAIVLVASKCARRGVLVRDNGRPHDAASIARITRMPVDIIQKSLDKALSEAVGWLELVEADAVAGERRADVTPTSLERQANVTTASGDGVQTTKERKGIEEKGREDVSCGEAAPPLTAVAPPSPAVLTYPCVGNAKTWVLTEAKLAEYAITYPGVASNTEARKAWQWCQDNPAKRKTANGMAKFLSGWFEREQNAGPRNGGGGGGMGRPGAVVNSRSSVTENTLELLRANAAGGDG